MRYQRVVGRWVGFPPPVWVTLSTGTRVLCDLGDHLGAHLFWFGSYSQPEIRRLVAALRPGDVCLDVGANIGLFSIEIARHVGPEGKVLAFEPASDAFQQLASNIAANSVDDRVDIFQMGLGDSNGRLPLLAMADDPVDMARRSLYGTGSAVESVEIACFDDMVESGRVALPRGLHAVKVDVEGAETGVIKGMRSTIARHAPRLILMETAEHNLVRSGSSVTELDEVLGDLGYVRSQHQGTDRNTVYVPRAEATSG